MLDALRAARSEEYAEILGTAKALQDYVGRETAHRVFTAPELQSLWRDLDKLRQWLEQVNARDYVGADGLAQAEAALARGEQALSAVGEVTAR